MNPDPPPQISPPGTVSVVIVVVFDATNGYTLDALVHILALAVERVLDGVFAHVHANVTIVDTLAQTVSHAVVDVSGSFRGETNATAALHAAVQPGGPVDNLMATSNHPIRIVSETAAREQYPPPDAHESPSNSFVVPVSISVPVFVCVVALGVALTVTIRKYMQRRDYMKRMNVSAQWMYVEPPPIVLIPLTCDHDEAAPPWYEAVHDEAPPLAHDQRETCTKVVSSTLNPLVEMTPETGDDIETARQRLRRVHRASIASRYAET